MPLSPNASTDLAVLSPSSCAVHEYCRSQSAAQSSRAPASLKPRARLSPRSAFSVPPAGFSNSEKPHQQQRRRLQQSTSVTTLSVATKESWKDADGQWKSRTDWPRVISFAGVAEYSRTLPKGSYVLVQGAVRTREYDRDGVKHRVVELRADTIGKLDRAERRREGEVEPDSSDA
ncbi:MAG: single-stranded DNA-binding protein [Bryobacteraceae bacterium]